MRDQIKLASDARLTLMMLGIKWDDAWWKISGAFGEWSKRAAGFVVVDSWGAAGPKGGGGKGGSRQATPHPRRREDRQAGLSWASCLALHSSAWYRMKRPISNDFLNSFAFAL